MEQNSDAKLLRIFIGEADKVDHKPLYEAILFAARKQGLAGCTVSRGMMSFGASTVVHTAKWIDISQDLPIIIEIVDMEEKINEFMKEIDRLLEKAGCGGLVTIEKALVLQYKHRKVS